MQRVSESKALPGQLPITAKMSNAHLTMVREDLNECDERDSQDSDAPKSARIWKGKNSLQEHDELMPDVVTFKHSGDSFDEGGIDAILLVCILMCPSKKNEFG